MGNLIAISVFVMDLTFSIYHTFRKETSWQICHISVAWQSTNHNSWSDNQCRRCYWFASNEGHGASIDKLWEFRFGITVFCDWTSAKLFEWKSHRIATISAKNQLSCPKIISQYFKEKIWNQTKERNSTAQRICKILWSKTDSGVSLFTLTTSDCPSSSIFPEFIGCSARRETRTLKSWGTLLPSQNQSEEEISGDWLRIS
jgi:hypothetical protein